MVGLDDSLRVAQVVLHIITVCGGLMTSIGLGWTVNIFSENCLLYTDMTLAQGKNKTWHIDYEETEWGQVEICYYCMFSSVLAAIYAIIWFWFYLLLSDWHTSGTDLNFRRFTNSLRTDNQNTEAPPDLKLFVPTLLINIVLFLCTTVTLGLITRGSREWCDSISLSSGLQCSQLTSVDWSIQYGYLVYTYLKIAQAGSWVLLLSVLGKIVIVGSRLYLHFRLEVTQPKSKSSKKRRSAENNKRTVTNEAEPVIFRTKAGRAQQVSDSNIAVALVHEPSNSHRNGNFSADEKQDSSQESSMHSQDTIQKSKLSSKLHAL